MHRKLIIAALVTSFVGLSPAWADDVVYYEKDGVTYREVRRKVQRPITQLEYQNQPQNVLREKVDYGTQDAVRTYQVPVTEYKPVSRMVGRWNPFVRQPYIEQRMVPTTRWETKTESVKIPCTKRSLVQEQSTARVPVYTTRVAEDEIISRVAVGTRPTTSVASSSGAPLASGSSTTSPSSVASSAGGTSGISTSRPGGVSSSPSWTPGVSTNTSGVTIGGVSKLDSDPPKVGNNVQWRPGSGTGQRY